MVAHADTPPAHRPEYHSSPMLDSDDDESIPPPPPPPPQDSVNANVYYNKSTEAFHDHDQEFDSEAIMMGQDHHQVAKPVKKWRLLKKEAEHVLVPQQEEEEEEKFNSGVVGAGAGAGTSGATRPLNGPTLQGHFRGIHHAQEFEEEEAGMDDIEVPSSSVVARMNWSEKQQQKKKSRFRWALLLLLGFAALVAIIVGSVAGSKKSKGDDNVTSSSSRNSPNLNTPMGQFLLSDPSISQETKDALEDPNSSASQALDWMIHDEANTEYAFENDGADLDAEAQEQFKERFAAASLGKALGSDNFVNANGWMTNSHICDWEGIGCDDNAAAAGGGAAATAGTRALQDALDTRTAARVVNRIIMNENNLSGSIPSEISMFTHATQLILYSNQITGTIPQTLYQMTQLTGLDLYDNKLTGTISDDIGNWSNMVGLYLSENNLAGSIPTTIGGMNRLVAVWLDGNQLTGPIPSEMGNISGLNQLLLSNNQLTGGIPENLANAPLERLAVDNNVALFLTSESTTFPTFLLNMQTLQRLSMRKVNLQGPIPTMVRGNLSSLTRLYLDSNVLTGTLQNNIAFLQQLEEFSVADNAQLGGAIPTSLGQMRRLNFLDLSNCGFEGAIPSELSGATLLEELYLNQNKLEGAVPTELGALVNLRVLRVDINRNIESVPTEVCQIGIPTLLAGCEATCECCTDNCAR